MSYAILRTKKLKSASQIARVGRHNEREQRTLNADPERTGLNVDYRPELTGSLVHRVRQRIGNRQHRTDAVLAVEVLMAYSPEAENKIDALSWGVASVDWLEKEIGRESIVSARLHQDEKTVHVACVFVPIDPAGRLNCKHYLGSPRKLAALQSRYAAAVSQFGLRRGEEGSKRKHVPIRDL
ncbi:MAG: plasmid recombination protein, partial [Chthoniobacterales bacterium]|nr:plasmid recombination protein [Chthoniobacterales bacterium]